MTRFGVCMTTRGFVCPLCGQPFTRETADLILPEDTICDSCLVRLGPLDATALQELLDQQGAEQHIAENS